MSKPPVRELISNILNPGDSLKWKLMQGSVVVVVGDVFKNVVRLGGNLIMTRLLFPEAFGLMLIVALIQTGLALLSDAGVRDAVVIKSRGRETEFMNTAWVMMISRGCILTVVTLLIAWPVAQFYNQPILIGLLAISSLTPLIDGFSSPRRFLYEREVNLIPVVISDIISQGLMLIVGIIVLYYYPTIWVLAFFGVFSAIVKCLISYQLFKGPRPRFEVNSDVFKEIFNFGKWVLLATALTFFASEGDKIFVSKLLSVEKLGVFSVALALAKVVEVVAASVSVRLLVPVYASIASSGSIDIDRKVKKIKLGMLGIFAPPILFFALFGSWLIELLYDDRYLDAGWMLQIMSVGALFSIFSSGLSPVIFGRGDVKAHVCLQFFKVVTYFVVLLIGSYAYGVVGVVYGIAIAPIFIYFAYSLYVMRYGVFVIKYDCVIFSLVLSVILGCWYYFGWPISLI